MMSAIRKALMGKASQTPGSSWQSCAVTLGPVPASTTLIVFDFDCTLAQDHMYYQLRSDAGIERYEKSPSEFFLWIFGGAARLKQLNECLSALRAKGATLVVLSNGFEEEITEALTEVDLHQHFSAVLGAESQVEAA